MNDLTPATQQGLPAPHSGRPLRILFKQLQSWLRDPRQFRVPGRHAYCPICGFEGRFLSLGTPPRWDGRCPNCGSRERHRLLELYLHREHINLGDGRVILHFAPERYFVKRMQGLANYHTADIVPGKARHAMDMADIRCEPQTVDVFIANHVLEHVADDHSALAGIYRVLRPGGFALLTVPLNWARETTYENPAVTSAAGRYAHYGDVSHLRYYGRDFPERLRGAGFAVQCWRLPPEQEPGYAITRDEVIWIAARPT